MRSILLTALGLMLVTPDDASAQWRRGWGGGSGWGIGYTDGGVSFGYSDGNWNRGYGYQGYGYPGYGYGRGYGYPYGYGGSGFSVGFGSGYSTPYYGGGYYQQPYYGGGTVYSSPGYMSGTYVDSGMGGNIYQAGYGAPMNLANVVRLDVVLPDDNAELMIQGQRVGGFGRQRSFVSPPLEQGKEYTYTVSFRSGQAREGAETTKKIDVKAGGQYTVDFTDKAGSERIPAPVPGIDRREGDRESRDRVPDRPDRPKTDAPPAPGGSTTPPR